MDLARTGIGLAYVPRFALGNAFETRELVPLLDNYKTETGPVGAVYLEGRTLPRKVRALIDFAVEDMKKLGLVVGL